MRRFMVWAAALLLVSSVSAVASAAPPVLLREFVSSSGRTTIRYYRYDATGCAPGVACYFNGVLPTRAGYDHAEAFLSGFAASTRVSADDLRNAGAQVRVAGYDAASGNVDISVDVRFTTGSNQASDQVTTFAVILTRGSVARFTPLGGGCNDYGRCNIVNSLFTVPAFGMQYIGLATRQIQLASAFAVPVNTVSAQLDGITYYRRHMEVSYGCTMSDASGTNPMSCEWAGAMIWFDPSEMDPGGGITSSATGTTRQAWVDQRVHPAGASITGFLDLLESFRFEYASGVAHQIWSLSALADRFDVVPPSTAERFYDYFLGTSFGNTTTAQTYSYQVSRAFGFLR